MDTEKCKILLKTVDCGSLSTAAAELGYTPAGIGYIVDVVESELGFPVLYRGRTGVTLTSEGKRILPVIQELVESELRLEQRAFELRNLFSGEITIGTFSSIASQLMPQIIEDFQKEYPGITIHLVEGIEERLKELLSGKKVDFCICSYQKEDPFRFIPLRRDPMICVLPSEHPLAKQTAIQPEQLRNEPMIMPGYGRDPDVLAIFKRFCIEPRIKYSTVEYNSVFAMVERGLGLSIANELVTVGRVKNAVLLPFDPPQYIVEGILLRSLETASPITKKFMKFLEQFFSDCGEEIRAEEISG